MRKHALVLVLLALLPGFLFAQGTKETVAAPTGPVTLTIWGRDIPDTSSDHIYVHDLIENFQKDNPDIKLEYIALGDPGLADKTKITMATGVDQLPEIIQSWGGSVMGGYADAGRLLDLTEELSAIPGSKAAQDAMSWKGKIYGVAPFFAVAGIFLNEEIFAKYGLQPPTTVAEMEKVCDTLLAKGVQPFACGAKDKWPPLAMYMYLVNRYGGDAFGSAQARKIGFDDATFVKAAKKYQQWVSKGYFGDKPLGDAYGDAQQQMASGRAAMMVTGSWMCAQFSDPTFTDQKLGFYAFPVLDGGVGKLTDVMGQTDIGFIVTKKAEAKKDATVRFLKYAMGVNACSSDPGRICSVPGVPAKNNLTGMASELFSQSKTVQFWWDQDLPPAVTSPLNDTIQSFFLPGSDVASAMTQFEALVADEVGPVKK